MKYILTSLNQTTSRALAVKNYIQMAFRIDPREIRYDRVPSIVTRVTEVNPAEREILIRERIDSVITDISRTLGVNVNIIGIESTNDKMLLNIQVEEELIRVKL